jgi:DMSO/TMAO reductase YedYZ molybdopterin-dependent catalytic subunit
VNKSAVAAGVVDSASDPAYRLEVVGSERSVSLSLDDLRGMPQTEASLPIACVEGWSASATWQGVRVRDLVGLVAESSDSDVRFVSRQTSGLYGSSVLPALHARDDLSLLALRINGEELDLDHGFPCRLIAPNRPGVLQTKWVQRIEVQA